MKVLILAAGYATRLYPLTLTQPKPLLPVAGKPMIDHVLDNLASVAGIERIYVVTNAKFAAHFQKWADDRRAKGSNFEFTIVNDGSTDDSNKLGAIGDIHHVLETHRVDDDLIVVAGDNLFSEKLDGFGKFIHEKNAPVLALYDVGDLEQIKKYNSISVNGDGRIVFFEEKPKNPTTTLTGIALYYYPRSVFPSSGNTLPRETIRTSRDGWCNGFIPACPFTPGAFQEPGLTSARRRPSKRPIKFSRNLQKPVETQGRNVLARPSVSHSCPPVGKIASSLLIFDFLCNSFTPAVSVSS